MVTDNHEVIENAKKYWEQSDVNFQVYSPNQWQEGLESSFFRQQLSQGLPALAAGNQGSSNNLVSLSGERVQKMEQLEAKAIEEAIQQYKGNLTEAAKALGIGRATLYRKVKLYHIDPTAARRNKRSIAA